MNAPTPKTGADEIRSWLEREPDAEQFEFPREWIAELLADRARMTAELAKATELVELLRRARAELHLERDQARAELEQLRANVAAANSVYRERAHLVALLAAQFNSWWAVDPDSPDWPVVYIDLPVALTGGSQLSWHIAPDDWADLFAHLDLERRDGTWDGHSTEEKYRRIDEFARQLHEAAGPGGDDRG